MALDDESTKTQLIDAYNQLEQEGHASDMGLLDGISVDGAEEGGLESFIIPVVDFSDDELDSSGPDDW